MDNPLKNIPLTPVWDYNGFANNANFFGTQKDWNQTLTNNFNIARTMFIRATQKRPNLLICGVEMCSILESLDYFH
jgi:hypothetical protein